jgi:hypothetical protein
MSPDSEVCLLDKITVYNSGKTASVTLPRTKQISVGAQEISKSVTMASGKLVKDIVGYRASVKASWDYVPASAVAALVGILRGGGFCFVEYPSPSGDASGYFEIDYPTMSVFGFKNGIAVWHDVTLSMSAQEVE